MIRSQYQQTKRVHMDNLRLRILGPTDNKNHRKRWTTTPKIRYGQKQNRSLDIHKNIRYRNA